MENTQRNQRVLLNIVNLSKYHNLFRNGMTPLVKSTSRPRLVIITSLSLSTLVNHILIFSNHDPSFSFEVAEDAAKALLLLPLPGPQEAHGALLRLLLRQGRREVHYEYLSKHFLAKLLLMD